MIDGFCQKKNRNDFYNSFLNSNKCHDETIDLIDIIQIINSQLTERKNDLKGLFGCGENVNKQKKLEAIASEIFSPETENIIFILIDGLAYNFIDELPKYSTLRQSLKSQLSSLLPSTTSSVLTSLFTGVYPVQHGVLGWDTYFDEYNQTFQLLPFVERFSGKHIDKFASDFMKGVEIDYPKLFGANEFWKPYFSNLFAYIPSDYLGSPFSSNCFPKELQIGHSGLDSALSLLDNKVANCNYANQKLSKNTKKKYLHYFYYPDVDYLAHKKGRYDPIVLDHINAFDRFIFLLRKRLDKRSKIVIVADHGMINIEDKNKFIMTEKDPLMEFLKVPPACEARLPFFFLKDDVLKSDGGVHFKAEFEKRFSNVFNLISKQEAIEKMLFGIPLLGKINRIGDFVAFPLGPYIIDYKQTNASSPANHRGYHGAISDDEFFVPLCIL